MAEATKETAAAPKKSFKESCGKFCYDKETNTYLGSRDPAGWRKLGLFYFCFYGTLACFWAMNFNVMLHLLPDHATGAMDEPFEMDVITRGRLNAVGYFGTNVPVINAYPNEASANSGVQGAVNRITCGAGESRYGRGLYGPRGVLNGLDEPQQTCAAPTATSRMLPAYDLQASAGECSTLNNYGITSYSPCVFFTLNNVFNYPSPFDRGDIVCSVRGSPARLPEPTFVQESPLRCTQGEALGDCEAYRNQAAYQKPVGVIKFNWDLNNSLIGSGDFARASIECRATALAGRDDGSEYANGAQRLELRFWKDTTAP